MTAHLALLALLACALTACVPVCDYWLDGAWHCRTAPVTVER